MDDARAILLAAIRAVDARSLTVAALRRHALATSDERVRLIAVGKAAAGMTRGALEVLASRLVDGVVIAPPGPPPSFPAGLSVHVGGHPLPTDEGVRGARDIISLINRPGPASRVLCLISGGASAMMTLPPDDVLLGDVVETTRALLAAGATIEELNCVRKHLDQLKGGKLGCATAPVPTTCLVLSDVIGNRLDVIASGPLVADGTTFSDAIEILKRRDVWSSAPASVAAHLERGARGGVPENPGAGDPRLAHVTTEIIGDNSIAVEGASHEAARRRYAVEVDAEPVSGEAREMGAWFARRGLARRSAHRSSDPLCILAGGECTVRVTGRGRGGRNQEFVAGAALALELENGVVVGSIGTDGVDGPTAAAGGVVDCTTVDRARDGGIELEEALRMNDANTALESAGALVVTGPTGTNVMDVHVVLVG